MFARYMAQIKKISKNTEARA